MSPQIAPVGPHPGVDVLFIGSLLWSGRIEAGIVLAFVHDDDFESTVLSIVVAAIRQLVLAEKPIGPQMVMDELRRTGELTRQVAVQLQAATTSGADSGVPVRHYAAPVVADSLRRRVESAGVALTTAADEMAEDDLAPLVQRAAVSVRDCANRLAALRGEQS